MVKAVDPRKDVAPRGAAFFRLSGEGGEGVGHQLGIKSPKLTVPELPAGAVHASDDPAVDLGAGGKGKDRCIE